MPFYKRSDAKNFISKIQRDRLLDHASSLTFTTILSLIPMIALAYFFFAAFGGVDKFKSQFENFIAQNLAPSFAEEVMTYVTSIQNQLSPGTVGIVGFVGFMFTSLLMLDKVESAFNLIWGAIKPRPLLRRFTNYWTLFSIGPVLLGCSLFITTNAIDWLRADSGDLARIAVFLVTHLAPIGVSSILFFCLFYLLPNAGINRRDAIVSALVTGFVFEIAKVAYAFYAGFSVKTSVYGSLAILPVFFLWVYVIWMITLLGFEFCCYLEARRMNWIYEDDEDFSLDALLLFDVLEVLGQYQVDGKGVELKDIVRVLNVNRRIILKHIEFLKDQDIVVQIETDKRDCHIYHLAYGKETLNHRKMLEALEEIRFKPVGPVTRSVAEKQNKALMEWSLRNSPAVGGPLVAEVPTSKSKN